MHLLAALFCSSTINQLFGSPNVRKLVAWQVKGRAGPKRGQEAKSRLRGADCAGQTARGKVTEYLFYSSCMMVSSAVPYEVLSCFQLVAINKTIIGVTRRSKDC